MSTTPTPQLRIDDARRDQVASQLSQHMAAGRLTPAEFEDRLGRALTAKTESELRPLLADLPSLPDRRRRRITAIAVAVPAAVGLIVAVLWAWTPLFDRPPTASHSATPEAPPAAATTTEAAPTAAVPPPVQTTRTATVTPPPATITVTAEQPTQTVTVEQPTQTVTAEQPTPAPPVEPTQPPNRCPFPSPMSPPQFAQAGAACAWGKTEYCDCVNYA